MVKEVNWQVSTYLSDIKSGDISDNQDVQRRFCSDKGFVNGIAVTLLTGDYLPPIILGEVPISEGLVQQYIVDAMQRTSAMMLIRYGNYRITRSVENAVIEYQEKRRDDKGVIMKDDEGNILWDRKTFDIRGKTFGQFPQELQNRFDKYQLHIVIHQNCTMEMVSQLVRKYNNHRAMNAPQRAFTHIPKFARKVRQISESAFFKETMKFSVTDNRNGKYENAVCEACMAVFHLDDWKSSLEKRNDFLNDNATEKEFDIISQYAYELHDFCHDDYQDIFVFKNIGVWFEVYHRFKRFGRLDSDFKLFLDAFRGLKGMEIEGVDFETLDSSRTTKGKSMMVAKINHICILLNEFLGIKEDVIDYVVADESKESVCDFVNRVISNEYTESDIDFCENILEGLTLAVDNTSPLLNPDNHKSMIALVAYSMENDKDLDEWIVEYFNKNSSYICNQTENYKYMKDDLENYLRKNAA